MTPSIKTFVLSTVDVVKTMTSMEIVSYINECREDGKPLISHPDFLKKVDKVLKKDAGNFSDIYLDAYGREQRCFNFPKREANLMVMSESYEVQARVYDRMAELENNVQKPVSVIPDFDNPIAAARAWIVEREAVLELAASVAEQALRIAHDAPKVEYVDKFIEVGFDMNLRDAWKSLHVKPNIFSKHLVDEGVLYEKNSTKHAYSSHINAGYFVERQTNFGTQVYVTPKGKTYIAKRFSDWLKNNTTKK